jgi:putative heme degradation protein
MTARVRTPEHNAKIAASNRSYYERMRQEKVELQERLDTMMARVQAAQQVLAEVQAESIRVRAENLRLRAQLEACGREHAA